MFKDINRALWTIASYLKDLRNALTHTEEPLRSMVTIAYREGDGSTPAKIGIDLDSIVWYQYFDGDSPRLDIQFAGGDVKKFYKAEAHLLVYSIIHNREIVKLTPEDVSKFAERALDSGEPDHDPDL